MSPSVETYFVPSKLTQPSTLVVGFVGILLLTVLYYAARAIYNLYFHPLSKYPGPWLASASSLWYARSLARGTFAKDVLDLHNKYGDVVRIAPEELSYIIPEMWKEIYGHKVGRPEIPKDPRYHDFFSAVPNILNADKERHAQFRKLMSHGFSEKSLKEQEPVLQDFVNLLIRGLQEKCQDGQKPLDLVAWYNYCTFDVIGFLTFGETFECLSSSSLHPWIELTFDIMKIVVWLQAARRLPRVLYAICKKWVLPKQMVKNTQLNEELTKQKVLRRLEITPSFADFMHKILDAYHKGEISFPELLTNAVTLTIAGSETTATLLSGVTYYLLANPSKFQKITEEVRSSFTSADEITISSANRLEYMLACLDEALRIYPPSTASHTRITPPEGIMLNGELIPGGMGVGIPMYAMFKSERNFSQPESFIPERWMGDPAFADDKRDALQPFSVGPRNCIGRNLAYVEMRLVMAKMLWNFDMELCPESRNWADQKTYLVWEKHPLWVKLTPVKR